VQTVGIIGLGLLGGALARRLLKTGLRVAGYDLSADRRAQFTSNGGIALENSRAVANAAEALLLCLPDSNAVEEVVLEFKSSLAGKLVSDTTTGDPDRTAHLGSDLCRHETRYNDATVLGSSREAEVGNVIVMVGGKAEHVQDASSMIDRFAKQWFHMGPAGSGARTKLVVNLVLGLNRAVLAEGLTFAQVSELDPEKVLNVLKAGAAYSRVMDSKGAKMVQREFAPEARLSQHRKDVRLILEQGQRHGGHLPLSRLHEQLLAEAENQGLGDLDNSAIIEIFRRK